MTAPIAAALLQLNILRGATSTMVAVVVATGSALIGVSNGAAGNAFAIEVEWTKD